MSTQPANDQLSAYLDGELEEAEAAAVEAALQGSAELRAELDRMRSVQRLLRSHGPARAPEGFKERVMAAAREEKVVAFPWWRRPFGIPVEGVLIAAAAALVLIVALPKAEGPGTEPEVAPAAPAPDVGEGKLGSPGGDEGLVDVNPDRDDAVVDAGGEGEVNADGAAEPEELAKPSPKSAPEAPPMKKGMEKGSTPVDFGTADPGATDNAALPEQGAQGTDVEDPRMAASGLKVEMYTDNEAILGTLQAIAARHGGRIVSTDGKAMSGGLLDAGETLLFIDVPNDKVSAMNKELAALGAKVVVTSSGITSGSSIKVPVRIVITANGPTEPEPPPNAARQKQQMDDAFEMEAPIKE